MDEEEKRVCLRVASASTGIPYATLYGWVIHGKIPFEKWVNYRGGGRGGNYQVRLADVIHYQRNRRRIGVSETVPIHPMGWLWRVK